jgi:hypothetical protein
MAAASSARRTTSRVRATKTVAAAGKTAKAKAKAKAKSKSVAEKPATDEASAGGSPERSRRAPPKNSDEATTPRAAAGSPEGSRSAPTTTPRSAAGSRNASRRAPTKKSLVQRVYNTIDGELTKLEKQKGLTSQDRERASRALSQMVNALEKAVEMQRDMTKTRSSGGDAKQKEALAHAEDLRREIANRLERLNRKRPALRRSE